MEDKKVFKFLSTFGKRRLNHFEDYINSPYFNKSEELCYIYKIVKKYILSSSKKSFQAYFEHQLPKNKKPVAATNLDKYLSRIYLLALDFVAQEKLKEKAFLKSSLLMEHLIDGDELKMFEKVYAKTKVVLNKEKLSYQNLYNKYLLEEQKANYLSLINDDKKNRSNLQETSDALDQFYLAQKYYLEIAKVNIEKLTNQKFNYLLIEQLDQILNDETNDNDILLVLLIRIYRFIAYNKSTKTDFETIKNLILKCRDNVDEEISYNLSILVKNILHNIFNGKTKEYTEYSFLFNKQLLETGLLFYRGELYLSVFKNILELGILNNELEWCKDFVYKHSDKLTPQHIAIDMKNYALARLEFYSGNYETARNNLVKTNFSGIDFRLAVMRLEIMIFYEMKEYFFLESLINKFRVALNPKRSQQLSEIHRELNKTFINWVAKLMKLQTNFSTLNFEELKNLLESVAVPNKPWLSKKIQEAILGKTK